MAQPALNENISEVRHFPVNHTGFFFEKNFDLDFHRRWFDDNWTLSLWFSAIYMLFLFVGTKVMKDRPAFDLRVPLGLWSFSLAIFSAFGCIRIIPHWINMMTTSESVLHSFCRNEFAVDRHATFFIVLFIWSKVIELGDTVFIVLRKQKLIFLHWFHHVLTLTYSFYSLSSMAGPILWFCAMNTAIHTAMYAYYGIKALRLFFVPKHVNMLITTSQILQMIIGFIICLRISLDKMSSNSSCGFPVNATISGLVLYSSFLILFVNFFVKSYFATTVSSAQVKKSL